MCRQSGVESSIYVLFRHQKLISFEARTERATSRSAGVGAEAFAASANRNLFAEFYYATNTRTHTRAHGGGAKHAYHVAFPRRNEEKWRAKQQKARHAYSGEYRIPKRKQKDEKRTKRKKEEKTLTI